eukprot:6488455-Amphidinium_carterae.2
MDDGRLLSRAGAIFAIYFLMGWPMWTASTAGMATFHRWYPTIAYSQAAKRLQQGRQSDDSLGHALAGFDYASLQDSRLKVSKKQTLKPKVSESLQCIVDDLPWFEQTFAQKQRAWVRSTFSLETFDSFYMQSAATRDALVRKRPQAQFHCISRTKIASANPMR